jgi:asparagine synthase (glutamine-hydrolysing)
VLRLPPAHALVAGAADVRIRQYWDLRDTTVSRLGSDAEYVERLLELYQEAVRCRLRSERPVGITLSGGLDSGSVAALAAPLLKEEGRTLHAFSSVPAFDTSAAISPARAGDETFWINATRDHVGNIALDYVDAGDTSPLEGVLAKLDTHDEPGHAAGNAFWMVALYRAAQARDLGTLLIGQFGNATVSWTWNGAVRQRAREEGWIRLLKGLRASGKTRNEGLWRALKRDLLRPLVPPASWRVLARMRMGDQPWLSYSAIRPALAKRLELLDRMAADGHDPYFAPWRDSRSPRFRLIGPGRSSLGSISAEMGARFGLEVRDPTIDKRLLEFCLSVPDEQYRTGDKDRWLIRRAMKGLLPDDVLWNTRKGYQAADIGFRIRRTSEEIEHALARLESSDLAREYLDLGKMRRVLDRVRANVNQRTTAAVTSILMRGLNAGLFLLKFEKEPRTCEPEAL